jgi:bacterioferritin-associated ferredoxin
MWATWCKQVHPRRILRKVDLAAITDFRQPRPVHKCACGADCAWCVGANAARAAFPRAKVAPRHDADTSHECVACFEVRAKKAIAEGGGDVTIFECNPTEGV